MTVPSGAVIIAPMGISPAAIAALASRMAMSIYFSSDIVMLLIFSVS
jgi:hypothetical protein